RPRWEKFNDIRLEQHVFIYRREGDEMHEVWMSSSIGKDVYSMAGYGNDKIILNTRSGEHRVYIWKDFGLEYVGESKGSSVSVVCAGDNLIHPWLLRDKRYTRAYDRMKEIISAADIATVNQETVLVKDRGLISDYPRFALPAEIAGELVDTGFDVITLANNHMLDLGMYGVDSTVGIIEEAFENADSEVSDGGGSSAAGGASGGSGDSADSEVSDGSGSSAAGEASGGSSENADSEVSDGGGSSAAGGASGGSGGSGAGTGKTTKKRYVGATPSWKLSSYDGGTGSDKNEVRALDDLSKDEVDDAAKDGGENVAKDEVDNAVKDEGDDATKDEGDDATKDEGEIIDMTIYDPVKFMNCKGVRIAFLAYTYGTNGVKAPENYPYAVERLTDENRMIKQLKYARARADIVLVFPHWGEENSTEITDEQKRLTAIFLKEGCNAVIGTHPHVVQKYEVFYRNVSREEGRDDTGEYFGGGVGDGSFAEKVNDAGEYFGGEEGEGSLAEQLNGAGEYFGGGVEDGSFAEVPSRVGDGMVVYYSLGNFVSGQTEEAQMEGGLAKFTIEKTPEGKTTLGSANLETFSIKGALADEEVTAE
ncbi:MAG: CapA family protein, partial [Lachnospiraceae bacterium]|nr:CapA family protein [Lachnospiraceae bacterium]